MLNILDDLIIKKLRRLACIAASIARIVIFSFVLICFMWWTIKLADFIYNKISENVHKRVIGPTSRSE